MQNFPSHLCRVFSAPLKTSKSQARQCFTEMDVLIHQAKTLIVVAKLLIWGNIFLPRGMFILVRGKIFLP